MIDRMKIWGSSKPWLWELRTSIKKIDFIFERSIHRSRTSATKAKENARILGSFTWFGVKSLFLVLLGLVVLIFIERYIRSNPSWLQPFSVWLQPLLHPLSEEDKKFNIEQLRLYAQLLTAIFSIYFATIGIILSAGYTKLRRDIIQMLTNEQVGSIYSKVLVLAAMFCLTATALPLFSFQPGLLVQTVGTILTLLSALALFPLGQRLFNFFDLCQLVQSEILPSIVRHIEGASNPKNSISLANFHSRAARQSLEQLSYIDDRIKADKEGLEDNLPALSYDYTVLLLLYLQQKHNIDQESYWFPRRSKHKQWFFAGDIATSRALQTSSQQMLVFQEPDHQWFESVIIDSLAGHIELAFQVGNFELALKLIRSFSTRISAYAHRFQFDVGMEEIKKFKEIIEQAFDSPNSNVDDKIKKLKREIANTWAALGTNLCLETLSRMVKFESQLQQFFEKDEWSRKSLRSLPAFMQVELAFIVKHIEFEEETDGQRLTKPKYVQQLTVQKLLKHYAKVLPTVCDFYQSMVPDFVDLLSKVKMTETATQVVLASLHSHWKLLHRFEELSQLMQRYQEYRHYSGHKLAEINMIEMSKQLGSARDAAIAKLGSVEMVSHIFEPSQNDELPDHFGQIYFELAEACIGALEQNDRGKLDKVLPMFLSLTFLAENLKFADPLLDVNDEYRLLLYSTVVNDLATVIGFAILYAEYFDNKALSESALAAFDSWIENVPNKQLYLRRMLRLSNPFAFGMSASPRSLIRDNWKMSFERRARQDGFEDQMGMSSGAPHPNAIVREFLKSHSEASHLFFAIQVVPQLESNDFDIDYRITNLERRLQDNLEVLA